MSFQFIVDNAEQIKINRMPVVASTTARDGSTRAVSRGFAPWSFEIKFPDGPKWTEIRSNISKAEALGKTTVANISLNNTGHDWIVKYQGNAPSPSTFVASWVQGSNSILVSGGGTITSGFKFKAGDFVQLGTGKVYTVADDVPYTSNTVLLHRPVLETTGSGALKIGANCVWSVICTQFPQWQLFARDQVSWDGPFIFVENLV
jgi:hypothetical protein